MALIDDLKAVAAREGATAAVRLAEARAVAGEAAALAMMGHWRLFGTYVPQDVVAGCEAIAQAARAGDVDAAFAQVALVAGGAAASPDPRRARMMLDAIDHPLAVRQRGLLDAMGAPVPEATVLRRDPSVRRIDGLWSAAECAYVVERATPRMRSSWVVDPQSGRRIRNPVRTSDGTNFPPVDEDLVLVALTERIARATGTAREQGEPLHVLRYAPGQEYRWHVDALPGVANQRVTTALIYLTDDFTGGATAFDGGMEVRGGIGDAIVFDNVDATGRGDPRTRHAGLPVSAGTKWLATRWIRARALDPWRPETME